MGDFLQAVVWRGEPQAPNAAAHENSTTQSYLKRFAGEINTVIVKAAKLQRPRASDGP
jgi:hypothetical protein